MTTLYKHQILCLHGTAGQISADISAADTSFPVEYEVLQDVTIKVGSQIQLTDGANTSPILMITAIDMGTTTLTVDLPVGHDFQETAPTLVNRLPHTVQAWTESKDELTTCPEDATHPIQPGSAITVDSRAPTETKIIQSVSNLTHPEIRGEPLNVAAGATGTVDFSWPYLVTAKAMMGYFEAVNEGDRLDFLAAPNTPVGTASGPVAPGTTTFGVTETVIANARPSNLCSLSEGATTDDLGRIVSVDANASTITVSTATTNAFTAAAAVLVTTACALDMPLPAFQTKMSVGGDQIEGTDIPPGMVLRVVYRNAGPNPSRMVAYAKYLT